MYVNLLQLKTIGKIFLIILTTLLISCGSDSSKKQQEEEVTVEAVELDRQLVKDINTVKQVFYSLPSPLETAMILKRAGATFNSELLNPIDNVYNYTTNKSMALNLGIYTTDLSYASLFDQTQESINYMAASKRMAEGLGILNAIDDDIVQRLEENVNNRDVILDIISETIMNSSSFLEENDRQAIAAIVLVGGWIEGLYIATSLIDPDAIKNNELVERVVDQKLSFGTVFKLLERNNYSQDVVTLIEELSDLKKLFDEIEFTSSKAEVVTDEKSNVAVIKAENKTKISPEQFEEISENIKALRNNFIL